MVRLVVQHHQVLQGANAVEHGHRRVDLGRRLVPEQGCNRVDGFLISRLALVDLLDVGKEDIARCLGHFRLAAQDDVDLPVAPPLRRNKRQLMEDAAPLEVYLKAFEDDHVRCNDHKVLGKLGTVLEPPVQVRPDHGERYDHCLPRAGGHLHRHAGQTFPGQVLFGFLGNLRDIPADLPLAPGGQAQFELGARGLFEIFWI